MRVPIEVRVSGAGVEFGLSTKYFGAGERGMLLLPLGAELAVECV